jgi:hypothetical protein
LFDYNIAVGAPDTANTNHHFLAELSVDVIGELDFNIRFVWDRVGDPQADDNGDVPENDDLYLTFGVKFTF